MGRFAEDMARLRDEIEADRSARQTLIADTRQEVADAAQAFISDLKDSVQTLQADFREAHASMVETARADRAAFLDQLGGSVADLQRETVSLVKDLAGERQAGSQAWRGGTAPPAQLRATAKTEPASTTPAPKVWRGVVGS
jgi:uncharacterized protein YukE